MSKKPRKVMTGTLINKLERNIALANMRGDKAAVNRFAKMLEVALNSTKARNVLS